MTELNTKRRPLLLPKPKISRPALFILAGIVSSCLGRSPVLAPPPTEITAAEGYGHAVIEGEEGIVKGKFSFLFRRPDLGRIDALDPLNRTAYFVITRGPDAYLVIPSKRVYVQDRPEFLFRRLLGFPVTPGEAISLLSDRWPDTCPQEESPDQWKLDTDERGRVVRGEKNRLSFAVEAFYRKAGVPKEIRFSDGRVSAFLRVLSVRFNPLPLPGAFETQFVKVFAPKSWEEIQEIMKDEDESFRQDQPRS